MLEEGPAKLNSSRLPAAGVAVKAAEVYYVSLAAAADPSPQGSLLLAMLPYSGTHPGSNASDLVTATP
ncbi:hypothetical protein WJX82_010486 [Trebouxia sp. C0006]